MDARQANILVGETAAVVAAMRQNSKWAMVPRYMDGSAAGGDDPLFEKFRALRKSILNWTEWGDMRPNDFLEPFLDIVRSVETSGPITGTALSSIHVLLTENMIGQEPKEAKLAMHKIVDAVTHCRFEATDPSSDEVVLSKILQVLLACISCPSGELLSDDDVCNIIQACYRIGHQNGKSGSLLQQLSKTTLTEVTRTIFKRIRDIHKMSQQQQQTSSRSSTGEDAKPSTSSSSSTNRLGNVNGAAASSSSSSSENDSSKQNGNAKEEEEGGEEGTSPTQHSNNNEQVETTASATKAAVSESKPYGISCLVEVFAFLTSLVAIEDEVDSEESCIFGLSMIRVALEAGHADFSLFPELIDVIRDDLMSNMLRIALIPNLAVLSTICSIAFLLYTHLRRFLRLQFEAFISNVILRIADGEYVSYEQQEIALESLVAFSRHPTFMVDLYANLDCSIDRGNVFEAVCNLLSKNTFPVNSPLASTHILSLDGLLAIFNNLLERSKQHSELKPTEYKDPSVCSDAVWQTPSVSDFSSWAEEMKYKKYLKRRIDVGVDHFNRDPKKGFQFLQSINLLPQELTPESVAKFFHTARGLSKNVVGELLGDPDKFYLSVLNCFVHLFDFTGMSFDHAIRLYLESFFLPGEAQKIGRILEAFSKRYYDQCPGIFADADAAYVLSYSLLMLHTDQHNDQVKKKMTVQEFIRNNRKINNGEDLPEEMLIDLYKSIATYEIRIQADGNKFELSRAQWVDIVRRSGTDQGILVSCTMKPIFDYDMFAMVWGPTIASISVVFDQAEDESIVQYTIDGFLNVAHLASVLHFCDAIDNLVTSLCKFITTLNPKGNESDAFIEDSKAMLALVTMFCIVNQYGDCVRSGWRSVIDCILKLHRLHLLPTKVTDMEEVRNTLKNSNNRMSFNKNANIQTSILQSVSNFLSFDSGKPREEVKTPEEEEAEKRITTYIESCHIEEIFTESKFLESESLEYLVSALIWSAGETPKGIANSEEEEERALLCLDLLISTTIRNRDRIELTWEKTFGHLKSLVDSATLLSPLVEKGVFGLLRICQRLVPYKEDVADELLRSLQLILKLDAKVADILAAQLFTELLHLVKASPDRIQTEACWKTFSAILRVGAHHLEASPAGFEILEILVGGADINERNLLPLLEAVLAFIEGHAGGESQSMKAMDLLKTIVDKVKSWDATDKLFDNWLKAVNVAKHACSDSRPQVRNQACVMLQQILLSSYSMGHTSEQWGQVMEDIVLKTVNGLVTNVKKHREHEFPEMDKTARIALLMLSKAYLQFLPSLTELPTFSEIWLETLSILDLCNSCSSDELSEAVPEALKNMILVMATQGILHPGWTDSKSINLWNVTWQRARTTSTNISPGNYNCQKEEERVRRTCIRGHGAGSLVCPGQFVLSPCLSCTRSKNLKFMSIGSS